MQKEPITLLYIAKLKLLEISSIHKCADAAFYIQSANINKVIGVLSNKLFKVKHT